MRPIRLELSAFGPFGQREVVDFTQYEDDRMFLLTGNTGAGKTTVFDAMCYALYGRMSGTRRDSVNVSGYRSQHAKPETVTEVIFDFEEKGEVFRVLRRPQHRAVNPKTGREKNYANEAVLFRVTSGGEEALTAKKLETDRKIEEILGLDRDQFLQINMIAQGEFAEVLLGGVAKRREMLRRVFRTEKYYRLEMYADDRLREAREQAKEAETRLATLWDRLLQGFSTELQALAGQEAEQATEEAREAKRKELTEARLAEAEEEADGEVEGVSSETVGEDAAVPAEDRSEEEALIHAIAVEPVSLKQFSPEGLALADRRVAEAGAERLERKEGLKLLTEALKQAEEELSEKTRLSEEYERLLAAETGCRQESVQVRSDLEGLKAEENKLAEAAASMEEIRRQAEVFRERIHRLEEAVQLVRRIGALKQDVERLRKQMEDGDWAKTAATARHEEAVRQAEDVRRRMEAADAWLQEHQEDDRAGEAGLRERNRADRPADIRERLEESVERWKRSYVHAEKVRAECLKTEAEAARYYEALIDRMLGDLAGTLAEGTPCPLCGSTEHPHLHGEGTEVADEVGYEERKKASEAARNRLAKAEAEEEQAKRQVLDVDGEIFRETESIDELSETYRRLTAMTARTKDVMAEYLRPAREALEEALTRWETWKETGAESFEADGLTAALKTGAIGEDINRRKELLTAAEHLCRAAGEWQTMRKRCYESVRASRTKRETERDALLKTEAQAMQQVRAVEQSIAENAMKLREAEATLVTLREQYDGTDPAKEKAELESKVKVAVETWNKWQARNVEVKEQLAAKIALAHRLERDAEQNAIAMADLRQRMGQSPEELTEARNALAEQTATRRTALEARKEEETRLEEGFKRLQEDVKALHDTYGRVEARIETLARVKDLVEVINGRKGRRNLSLETWLHLQYFREVIRYANLRLQRMTQGQFYFIVDTDNDDVAKEFRVFDNFTGLSRSVNSLSGGETFQASLALALGLADMISASGGGFRSEILFIDEGFGSLDGEALDAAIGTIVDLTNDRCLVGMISHVEALQERFERKIIVRRGDHGSHLEQV